MRDYPPEYDEYHAVEIKPAPDLTYPDYVDGVFWGEDGRVFFTRKDKDIEENIFDNYGEDIDLADETAVMEQLQAHAHTFFAERQDKVDWLAAQVDDAFNQSQRNARASMPTFDEFWKANESLLGFESEEAGEWVPEWCDDCNTWHKRAYCFNFAHEDGVRYIVVHDVDTDGDWDSSFYGEDDWDYCYLTYVMSDEYFKAWAEYWLWCAEQGGVDPLEDFYSKGSSFDECLAAAEDNLKYLNMRKETK